MHLFTFLSLAKALQELPLPRWGLLRLGSLHTLQQI
jgi:hypothetical protein